jgi:hypothetical protein
MNMTSFLKGTANLLMVAGMLKLVAGDLGSEMRRSPYGVAGTAAALGLFAGMMAGRRHRRTHRTIPTPI